MCLIHTLKADTIISNAWLKNIYQKNSDGIGAMLIEDGKMVVKKYVPKNFRRALRWYRREVEGREGVVHWRFATHGAVNLDNAHPYPVLTKEEDGIDLYLSHNGVMSEFDASTDLSDLTRGGYTYRPGRRWTMGEVDDRSDTYHFIRVVILPLVKPEFGGHPDNAHNPAIHALIASHIGDGNKLVFMDGNGRVSYVNGDEFVKWDYYDLYCSNTYAWDYASRKFESPVETRSIVAGDPRKFGGAAGGTFRHGISAIVGNTNPQSRFYMGEDDDTVVPYGWDKIEGDEPTDDAFDNDEWRYCTAVASESWDELNMMYPRVSQELAVDDLAIYTYAEGRDKFNQLIKRLNSGEITDLEFTDTVLDVAILARKETVA